ncbi:MAG: hypothetical protein U9R37_05535 [Campylobacterota bacterium]|nr:hypothetical protein [Campylobacterota bacterium]
MDKIYILLVFVVSTLFSQTSFDNSFITKYEYGKMLYKNPRGISCSRCHGDDARGKIISTFTHIKNKKKYTCTIKTEDITTISYDDFLLTLDPKLEKPKKNFDKTQVCEKLTYRNSMPTYFLTPEELSSIHFYLINKDDYE